jgi:hypothetical protein
MEQQVVSCFLLQIVMPLLGILPLAILALQQTGMAQVVEVEVLE